jgi:hypothetical protein
MTRIFNSLLGFTAATVELTSNVWQMGKDTISFPSNGDWASIRQDTKKLSASDFLKLTYAAVILFVYLTQVATAWLLLAVISATYFTAASAWVALKAGWKKLKARF